MNKKNEDGMHREVKMRKWRGEEKTEREREL